MSNQWKDDFTDQLCDAIVAITDRDEAYRFLEDLATFSEIKAFSQRLQVAGLLIKGFSYPQIVQATGASTATISRVKKFVEYGTDGYRDVLRKLATHPCIVSIAIGIGVMGLYTAGIQLPAPVTATVSALSDCSTALGMVAVGGILSDCRLRDVVNREVLTYSLYRLVLIPLCVAGLLLVLPVDPLTAQVSILLTAMPAASTTAMLAAKYRGDAPFASELVLSSTLLSLVTVPGVCAALSLVW